MNAIQNAVANISTSRLLRQLLSKKSIMSGLEVLGVAASAIQVAQVSLTIVTALTKLLRQISDVPKIARTRLLQVRTLVDLSRLIEESPQLQTTEVHAILQNCSRDAKAVSDLLQGLLLDNNASRIKKWAKAIGGVVNEDKIMDLLGSLELEKTSLALCIAQIDSSLLYSIDIRLDAISGDVGDISQSVRDELPPLRAAIENLIIQHRDYHLVKNASMEEKTAACLASLAARDQTSFLSQTLRRSREAGQWILKEPKYISWHGSSNSNLLCITANPGCGKTTLAAHIYHHASEEMKQHETTKEMENKPIMLCFFFHKSNEQADRTAIAALRTIITQLLQQIPRLLPISLSRYDSLSGKGGFEWSWNTLHEMMDMMLCQIPPGSKLYIILDAIDECTDESKCLILDWAQELVNYHQTEKDNTTPSSIIKILITSRPDENVFDRLSHFPTLEMSEIHTTDDMRVLILNCMREFSLRRDLDLEVTTRIKQFLEENAHGMFLWVVLIMEELARRDERLSDAVIASKLSRIPMTLLNTYETIIKIPLPTRRSDMWRCVRWLLYGKRGLTLGELESVLCLETGTSRWHDFPGDLKYLCGSLIRFDNARGEINLIHQTARDFLERYVQEANISDVGNVSMDVVAANEFIAKICVQYLGNDQIYADFEKFRSSRAFRTDHIRKIREFLHRYAFLQYAIGNWSDHVHVVGEPSPVLSEMILQLLSSMKRRDGIMRLRYLIQNSNPYPPINSSPIHLAAYFNFAWLVKRYISESQDKRVFVNQVCTTGDTPLVWAAEMGSLECARVLLDTGVGPNIVEYDGWSPLHWAARNGHLKVVELLLNHGANVDQVDGNGLVPLDWAVSRENWEVVKILDPQGNNIRDVLKREELARKGSSTAESWRLDDYRMFFSPP